MDYGMDMEGMEGYGDEMGDMMDEYGEEGSHGQVRFTISNITINAFHSLKETTTPLTLTKTHSLHIYHLLTKWERSGEKS